MLVGGLNPSEKYERQLGWLATQYMGKYKNGNQTTNQHETITADGQFPSEIQKKENMASLPLGA